VATNVANTGVDFGFLRQIVFGLSQNVLDPSRDYLFETRLSKLLRNQGMAHLGELVHHLRYKKDPALERAVAEAMTINETSFFRDGRPFELLRTEMLPKLIEARRMSRTLRFWSAASSTGQEAYSLAMLIRENFSLLNRGLPARNVVRYFDHVGEEWTVKPEIKQMCNFRKANLCVPPLPFTEKFDVVFLRNVMLYFSQDTRKTLLAEIHRLLAPDGVLFLGSSEQPADPTIWTPVLAGGTCHFKPKPKV
jgi:chemotaxis protein methyltransferase CheR